MIVEILARKGICSERCHGYGEDSKGEHFCLLYQEPLLYTTSLGGCDQLAVCRQGVLAIMSKHLDEE